MINNYFSNFFIILTYNYYYRSNNKLVNTLNNVKDSIKKTPLIIKLKKKK